MFWSCLVWFVIPALVVVASWLCLRAEICWNGAFVCGVFAAFMMMMALIMLPCIRAAESRNIRLFKHTSSMVAELRASGSKIDSRHLQWEIHERNRWLEELQPWARKPLFDVFYPDEVLELEPIR